MRDYKSMTIGLKSGKTLRCEECGKPRFRATRLCPTCTSKMRQSNADRKAAIMAMR